MFYHGTSAPIGHKLLPPDETGIISEVGRKKNLGKVFFTDSVGIANIYAGRAFNSYGGSKTIYRVIPMGKITRVSKFVYMSDWAFVEKLQKGE